MKEKWRRKRRNEVSFIVASSSTECYRWIPGTEGGGGPIVGVKQNPTATLAFSRRDHTDFQAYLQFNFRGTKSRGNRDDKTTISKPVQLIRWWWCNLKLGWKQGIKSQITLCTKNHDSNKKWAERRNPFPFDFHISISSFERVVTSRISITSYAPFSPLSFTLFSLLFVNKFYISLYKLIRFTFESKRQMKFSLLL